jgi:hypothetical protein
MINTNLLEKVFRLKNGNHTGSGFTLYDKNDNEFIITAKHMVDSLGNNGIIGIFHNNNWKNISVQIYRHGNPIIDVAVIKTNIRLISNPNPINYGTAGLAIGQDTYFLGFPYGIISDPGNQLNLKFPMPFVKKAICSLVSFDQGITTIFLDGHNNPGFSGGPVCFKNEDNFNIAAVISGYRLNNPLNVTDRNGGDSGFQYQENSGIIISYGIKHAFEIIESPND